MCDARLYGPQIAALSGRVPIHLAPITERASVEELAADVLDTAPPRFALAGLSMGGIVAMEESDDEDAKTNDDDSDSGDSFMSLDDDDLDHIDAMREQVRHAPVGGR